MHAHARAHALLYARADNDEAHGDRHDFLLLPSNVSVMTCSMFITSLATKKKTILVNRSATRSIRKHATHVS